MISYIVANSNQRDEELYEDPNFYRLHLQTPLREIERIELVNLRMPNTRLTIKNNVNCISFSSSAIQTSMKTFSIPQGFYTPTELAAELTGAISGITGATCEWRSDLGRFLFSRDQASTDAFFLQVNTDEMRQILGFKTADRYESQDVPSAPRADVIFQLFSNNDIYANKRILLSEQLSNYDQSGFVFLDIEEFRSVRVECAGKLDTDGNVIGGNARYSFAPIMLSTEAGGFQVFRENSDNLMHVDFNPTLARLDRITVHWRDYAGDPIDFRGRDANSFILRVYSK